MKKLQNLVVLVVEDEPVQRASLVAQFRSIGVMHIVQAEDGRQAVHEMQSTPIDVVFCDIGMPHMDGPQFILHRLELRELQQGQATPAVPAATPILVWTSALGQEVLNSHVHMGYLAGFGVVKALSKPVDTSSLREIIGLALAQDCQQARAPGPEVLPESLMHIIWDSSGFEVWYRPLIGLEDAGVHGAQAVMHWLDAPSRAIEPRQVAALVERQGLGLVLFYRTVNQLLPLQVRLCAAGRAWQLCIDVAASILQAPEIADYLEQRLNLHRLRPEQIVLLVSDPGNVVDMARLAVCLNRLRIKGIHVYLNGFGVERANADLLSDLPFNGICIDGSLVRKMEHCAQSHQLVASIAALGARLGLDVMARGVDSQAQAQRLAGMGCRLGVGGIAAPVTADELLVAAGQARTCCM